MHSRGALLFLPSFSKFASFLGTDRLHLSQLIDSHAKLGWGEYRSHIATADQIMATYSAGDHAFRRLAEQIKDALDPNGSSLLSSSNIDK